MQKIIHSIAVTLALACSPLLADTTATTPTVDWTADPAIVSFRASIQTSITAAKNLVSSLTDGLKDTSIAPSDVRRLKVQNAIQNLNVKTTLAGNFWNNPVIQSPIARNQILFVLNKANITEGDLSYLQSVLDAERAKIAEQAAEAAQPAPTSEL